MASSGVSWHFNESERDTRIAELEREGHAVTVYRGEFERRGCWVVWYRAQGEGNNETLQTY